MSRKEITLLFVDDEERILRSLKMLFKSEYNVHITTDVNEALALLAKEKIHVLISDQRMPVMTGVDLLKQARQVSPNTIRLLLTGYADLSAIVGSVNEGEIFRYINKPWETEEIVNTVRQAAEVALSTFNLPPEAADKEAKSEKTVEQLGLLVIDDSAETYQTVCELVGEQYVVKWGKSLNDAFAVLSEENIAIVISEVKVANEDITAPLKTLKQHHPHILTLILTSFQDTKALIELINQGQIYRFLPKPILKGMLEKSLQASIRHYHSMRQQPQLIARHVVEKPKKESWNISEAIMGYIRRIKTRL